MFAAYYGQKVTYEQDDEMEIIEDHEDVEELEDWVKVIR